MINVAISGSSGFLGTQLSDNLNHKYNIIKLKRSDYSLAPDKLALVLTGCDYIINLAGAPIFNLWTHSYRKKILNSRIETTRNLIHAVGLMERKPKLFISASGVNIYDDIKVHNEESLAYANDFLANVCLQWEREALNCPIPVVVIRTGIILGNTGGFYKALTRTLMFGFVLKFGSGKNFFPFLHVNDYVAAMDFIMINELHGVFNMVSPVVATYQNFYDALQTVRKVIIVKVPSCLLKLLPGRQSSIFLGGQKVVPSRLLNEGFVFGYASVNSAVANLDTSS